MRHFELRDQRGRVRKRIRARFFSDALRIANGAELFEVWAARAAAGPRATRPRQRPRLRRAPSAAVLAKRERLAARLEQAALPLIRTALAALAEAGALDHMGED